ncbi:MAG: hypothetical protein Q9164_007029 [Protoblastenia rupestris]
MAPHPGIDTDEIREKARKDLLGLLEGVRGKKNLVIEKSLAGPIGLFVKFSTLQEHGVDKVFFLENDNVDASQKNVIFLARGEKATQPIAIAVLTPISKNHIRSVYYNKSFTIAIEATP